MGLDLSGTHLSSKPQVVCIRVDKHHPLMLLSALLNWQELTEMILDDLKSSTKKGFWWMGRKLVVRIHLAAYLLQRIYNLTDRRVEYMLKDNGAAQCFCGLGIVNQWHAPDHTKIEEFRNRLNPETQLALANAVAQHAVKLGFADPSKTDFDSTVQEANIEYPSDAGLLKKLGDMGKKFWDYASQHLPHLLPTGTVIDIKSIKKAARKYFFLSKNNPIEIKRAVFKSLHKIVKAELKLIINFCENLNIQVIQQLPWNIRSTVQVLKNDARKYLNDVAHFIRTHKIRPGKLLSFHAGELACISKGKVGKEHEFGRVFQLGRIGGNFMFAQECSDIRMNDKKNFGNLLELHERLFGEGVLELVATDKGYWSRENKQNLISRGIKTEGLQKPVNLVEEKNVDYDLQQTLHNRRAGIEPLIGHVKRGGQLGKSRMKSDAATLAAGYSSVLGFNLRQMIRHGQGKITVPA